VADILNIAYLATAAVSAVAGLGRHTFRTAGWWLSLGGGVAFVGLLRAAEAGLWIDGFVQHRIRAIGWYDYRRPLQVGCILLFATCLLVLFKRLPFIRRNRPLALGTCAFVCLMILAFIRFSSLHWTDSLLDQHLGSITISHSGQFSLLALLAIAACLQLSCRNVEKRDAA